MTSSGGASRVLLVEGQDDKHMVAQLCEREASLFLTSRSGQDILVTAHGHSSGFLITEKGNRSELLKSIRLEMRVPDREVIGILMDADDDSAKRWREIGHELAREGVRLPSLPPPTGTIVPEQGNQPRIGIWLMPDNKSEGELEDFALEMIPANDRVWPFSLNYIGNIPSRDRKFLLGKVHRAELYAWLAARKEPGRIGAAIGTSDLAIDGPLCRNFRNWLTRLFS